jgi:hypothetical protein
VAVPPAVAGATAAGAPSVSWAPTPRFSNPTRIDNPYLPLTVFRRCELRGVEGGRQVRIVRTLLDRTEPFRVGGRVVRVAVIEDRDYKDGELVERTLDYFGQSDNGTVYYFGEDVDDYSGGQVVGHGGQWRYGRDTNALGVAMPARPRVGATFRFEDVPGITTESDRVVAHLRQVRVRGKTYRDVIRIRESLRPEGVAENKLYARGVGTILELPPDGRVELVRCTR